MFYALMVGIIVVCLVLEWRRQEDIPSWLPLAMLGLVVCAALIGGFTWGYENLGPYFDARFPGLSP